ncbi:MAG: WYL domain-containing protein [Treponemataceae bacterium]|nr:WYL domain-containing protein [Treponemataceae bacterium]
MSQTERILFIDRRIRLAGKTTINETADKFEVSVRQVKRDIEYLRDRLQAPIIYDRKLKGYIYETEFHSLEFADQSLMLFYVMIKSLAENHHYIPIYSNEILKQIESSIPEEYREVCDRVSYQFPKADVMAPEYFATICEAVKNRKCLEITYTNLSNETSKRVVEPELLINYDGSWYMICYDRTRDGIRTFHISRILDISATKEKFIKHSKEYKEELKRLVSDSFGIFKGKSVSNVKIRFYDAAARIVESQTWHRDQKFRWTDKNKRIAELSFPVANFTEVLGKTLSYGSLAEPVKPKAFVDMWKEEIRKLAENAGLAANTEFATED